MTSFFQPTYSKEIFVGRQTEKEIFHNILDGKKREWIIHIPGEGGIGKTRLLETLQEEAIENHPNAKVTRELIDFYDASNQTEFGLLSRIAQAIDQVQFQTFFKAQAQFETLLIKEPEPVQIQEESQRVLRAFLADYQQLVKEGHQIVWLFDTCEEMGQAEEFVLETLLPAIGELEEDNFEDETHCEDDIPERHTIVIIAGRKKLQFPEILSEQVLEWKLAPLSLDDVKSFFEFAEAKGKISLLDASKIKRLFELTGGRPLYLALSYDWLKNEIGTIDELLTLDEPFGEKLVDWVRRLDTGEKRAILYTALAWRRMEPTLLGKLLETSTDDALSLIQTLSKFSFVKYRPESEEHIGAFQLHDEMRDLITKYVNLQEGAIAKNNLLSQVIDWYKGRIGDQEMMGGKKLPSQGKHQADETRALLSEWVYYLCQQDLDNGFAKYDSLFRNAVHYLDLAFCELLNREINRFNLSFNLKQKDDLRFKEALVAFRRENNKLARNMLASLVRQEDLELHIKATSLMLLVELESYVGKPEAALENAIEGEEAYNLLLNSAKSEEEKNKIIEQRGQLYNNWGYAYRVKGDNAKALEFYEKALAAGGRDKNIARTLNNMGFIYFTEGNMVKARTYVGRSLQIRRRLKIDYELGLGYNTMGIILEYSGRMEDAADSYAKALASFSLSNSERGWALVSINSGRIDRLTNRFDDAEEKLKKSIAILKNKGDVDYLIIALNELGCMYRQRGNEKDWDQSEDYLKESLSYSKSMKRTRSEVDNLVDLCILYEHKANKLRGFDNITSGQYVKLARETADNAGKLAKQNNYLYLLAKKERTIADLEYSEKKFTKAFNGYFEACRLMIQDLTFSKTTSPILAQRRYEEMVDRLQEQLQALPTFEETRKYAEILLKKYEILNAEEKERLLALKNFLDEANDIAIKVSKN